MTLLTQDFVQIKQSSDRTKGIKKNLVHTYNMTYIKLDLLLFLSWLYQFRQKKNI